MCRAAQRLVIGLVAGVGLFAATPAAGANPSPSQRLIDAYSPITMLRSQERGICDPTEEQYQPTTVDTVLGNPQVELKGPAGSGSDLKTIKRAPTAADIAGLGDGYYLDLPGDPLSPGCDYSRDFAELKRTGHAPAVTYAHIARQPGRSGFALQYWFFYYYNQFNDLHESDWEGMQISFKASNARGALARGPSEIVLFQHAGGERADWNDKKVEKEGTHPVVYPAAGSHATFYDSAVYIENGQNGSGVGCDNTSEPLRRLAPRAVEIPTDPAPGGPFQWLTYEGRWGQREDGFNNGPTGPNTKTQWLEPFTWMAGTRTTSPKLPDGVTLGPAVTNAFCGTIATVSGFINLQARTQLGALGLGLALLLLIVTPIALTRWRPTDLEHLRRPRAAGQLIAGAARLYTRHWRVLGSIGLTAIPIVVAIDLPLRALGLDGPIALDTPSVHLEFSGSFAGLGRAIGFAVVAGAAIAFMRLLESGAKIGFKDSYAALFKRFWRVVWGQILATVAVVLMLLTIVGIPFAIWKYVAWQFVQQEILFEDRSVRDAFRNSSRIVRGHWWRTVRGAGFFWLISVITGPALVIALIFTPLSPNAIDLLGSTVFALLVPYVAVGRTLLYFDIAARHEGIAAK